MVLALVFLTASDIELAEAVRLTLAREESVRRKLAQTDMKSKQQERNARAQLAKQSLWRTHFVS
jgi:hypothetical protein